MRVRLTPLCPAGHLPLKGGDRQEALPPLHSQTSKEARRSRLSISPLEGEMPGRAEGGKPHTPRHHTRPIAPAI
ncbi:lytic murein transglycosylase [Rhizobium rhizogenes]|uniref:Lytic murein transglycosylase n=1 Tax=Agrobacterium tumefaciens TaxID=358 RepID=A0A546Y0X6_AGRTU|nr:lytic murein transglycosylase [Rhizobium rhizogenes]TRB06613.1 lytic murein transglycosylase [Agrobacterium tumefaciens]